MYHYTYGTVTGKYESMPAILVVIIASLIIVALAELVGKTKV